MNRRSIIFATLSWFATKFAAAAIKHNPTHPSTHMEIITEFYDKAGNRLNTIALHITGQSEIAQNLKPGDHWSVIHYTTIDDLRELAYLTRNLLK